jgi:hypothetical protein
MLPLTSSAQTRDVNALESGGLYWTRYYLEWGISEKFQLDSEIENRRFFGVGQQYQTVARTTLYYLLQDFNIGAGIAYSGLYSLFTPTVQPEIRPHQEVNWNHGSGRWDFNHRIRLEERFRGDTIRTYLSSGDAQERNLDSFSFSLRTRYEFVTTFALVDKEGQKGQLEVLLATEIMVNDNLNEFLNTYRMYVGAQYFLTDKILLELGFLKSVEKEYDYDILYNYNNLRFTFRQRL